MKKIQVYLDDELLERLDQDAADTGQTRSAIIRGRLFNSFTNAIAYVNYVNQQIETAKLEDTKENK